MGLTHPIRCIFNWQKIETSVNSSKEEEKVTKVKIIKATSEFIVILCIMLEYFWSNFVDSGVNLVGTLFSL